MRYLKSILLLTNSLIAFIGCNVQRLEGEEVLFFSYNNNTPYTIQIKTYDQNSLKDSINIDPFTKLDLNPLYSWRPDLDNSTLFSSSNSYAHIIFESKKFINYVNGEKTSGFCSSVKKNPYCKSGKVSSYEVTYLILSELLGHAFFTYTFTEEDYNNATPLVFGEGFVGSVWRCTEGVGLQEGLVYNELRFVSENQVEGWALLEGEEEPELSFTAYYTLKGESLTISEDGDSFTATLNKAYTGLRTNIDGEGECIFIKQ